MPKPNLDASVSMMESAPIIYPDRIVVAKPVHELSPFLAGNATPDVQPWRDTMVGCGPLPKHSATAFARIQVTSIWT